jgi:serine protease Do
MKQFVVKQTLIAGLVLLTIPAFAQKEKEKEKEKNRETEHIVITRTGDNEGKTVIEIDGDKIKVNGKEVEKGKTDGITVQRHKYSGNAVRAFRGQDWDFNFDYDQNLSLFTEDANRAMLGVMTDEADNGAKITSITDESAAEKAGLKVGDVITRIDNEDIDDAGDVADAIREHKPGEKVTVTFQRGGKEQKVTAELGKWKGVKINTIAPSRVIAPEVWAPSTGQGFRTIYGAGGQPKLGLSIQDTDDGKGVKVLEVAEESNAAKAGLKEDDVITHIDDKAVNSTDEITRIIRESREKATVTMQVQRNGKTQKIEVKIPRKIKTADL